MSQCDASPVICFLIGIWPLYAFIIIAGTFFFGGAALLGAFERFRFNQTMRELDECGVEAEGMIIGKDVFHASHSSFTNLPIPRTRHRHTTYSAGTHRISYSYEAGGYRFEADAHVSARDWVNLDREAKVIVKYLPNKPNVSRLKDYTMYV